VLVYSYETTITADLVNTAVVTGTPVDEDGPIPNLEDVTDTNDAQVDLEPPTGQLPNDPDIALEKTVLAGGACPGVEGTDELVTGVAGTAVTYCFRVENTGNTGLFPVVPLAPDGVLVYSYETTITADLVNTAVVTGTPVDEDGPIPDLEDVTDTNDAQVDLEPPSGQVPPEPELPATGAYSDRLAMMGLILVLAGAGLVLIGRKTRDGRSASN
jgi:LPXTG-motif cell wall-anchored protein